jgi:hypothetical protein
MEKKDKTPTQTDVIDIGITPENESSEKNDSQKPPRARKQKRRRYNTHGILSRYPEEALAKAGGDTTRLRRIKRNLYQNIQPDGPLEELLLDYMCSCHSKIVLLEHMDSKAPPTEEKSHVERVREAGMLAMVGARPVGDGGVSREDARKELFLRYHKHLSREFRGFASFFLSPNRRDGGVAGALSKQIARHKNEEDDED